MRVASNCLWEFKKKILINIKISFHNINLRFITLKMTFSVEKKSERLKEKVSGS